jgi:[acyl-carrier-protein] S-malonyltransferase
MLPWLEIDDYAKTIDELSDASGLDLKLHGTMSDADTIRDTAIAQPLIVAASIASAGLLGGGWGAVAGHSVGEIAAASIAGILSPEAAIKLVRKRGDEMASAAALEVTGMAAIIGGETTAVLASLDALTLTPANFNGAGQIVAAGSKAAIEELAANPPTGARVIPLQVAGAFHTHYMSPAVSALADYASGVETSEPAVTIWSNQAAQVVTSGAEFLRLIVGQVANPVRWDLCMDAMVAAGVTAMIEVSPAGALAGLAKRAMPGVEVLALKTPDQIDAAKQLIKNHS